MRLWVSVRCAGAGGLMESVVGIGMLFFLGAGCLGLEVLGYPQSTIFQNLVYWACFLLILAVHELSKRMEKGAEGARALRAEIDGARDEIRRLQTDLRGFQGLERGSVRPSFSSMKAQGAPSVPSGTPPAQPRPSPSVPSTAAVEAPSPSEEFSIRTLLGYTVLAVIFLLVRFWPQINSWLQGVY